MHWTGIISGKSKMVAEHSDCWRALRLLPMFCEGERDQAEKKAEHRAPPWACG